MASLKEPPLDEIQWRSAETIQEMGGIHTNTDHVRDSQLVLHYFARSPFFDATSNNATLTTQAMYNQNLFYVLGTRVMFEERLRSMQGLEFMVIHDPSEGDTKPANSGVWTIRKQNRRKRSGMQDEITAISSYYVVGENIYMAPSVKNIISSRLLSAVSSLNKFLSTASTLSDFTPALGHAYLPPTSKHITFNSNLHNSQTSKESIPLGVGGTPVPDTQDTATTKSSSTPKLVGDDDYQDLRMLAESWDLSIRYGNDYMDENPIVGEPGSFKLSKARDLALSSSMSSTASTLQPFKAKKEKVSAPSIKIELPTEKEKKGTHDTAKSPATLGTRDKKGRRKSKAAGVPTPKDTTPKPLTPS
ncbi:MAG: hypothetical protein Q9163_003704 [Psora crenata]